MEHTVDIIFKYFPELTEKQKEQFSQLKDLYFHWNSQINVISRKDIEELYVRHVLHSLGIAKVMGFRPGAHVLDVGTGGGFPGIPLAIMFPETNFHLIDSIGKKITVVQNVAEALGLDNVKAEQIRAEKVKQKYDFVVSRAVTRIKPFFNWVRTHFKDESLHPLFNGILYLKGGDLKEEMAELKRPYREYDLPDFFEEDFFETKKVIYVEVE
ncbi:MULTISPECIES: 16S rRNA (guanine(527)-N(7))-methyltransferase RsmG [Persicobacter]|uniref:Ribosomal RNA small subunit methyltransferase G n=1 Tax=Persicobacter diffluens TaxID=981 RepID=A0AAN4VWU6_9BACT|nr:16S rRNA (guanine(527)-N(7))-methyltransferase RsmG [Persicobacter sp. CCB-QB2]GJM59780.1 ribosomal RNA small subunit methyltransferase G [Persicobacter diffluens]